MSTKKRHLYDKAWHELRTLCEDCGAYVSAGQFARHFGIARSTAKRWLDEMLSEGAIVSIKTIANNGIETTCYATRDNLHGNELMLHTTGERG